MSAAVTDPTMTALERLYRDEGPRLERALVLFAGDRQIAEDAIAEAFAQAIHGRTRVRDPRAWVWRAAFRIAAGELKDRSRRTAMLKESPYEMPEPVVDLVRALARLSPKQRASLVLFHYAGYPTKDVARIVGSTPAAVTVHLSVGRKRLRELLEDDNERS
jgi:DNA-directed RNA polymerase specialized sigma24 family protein